MTAREMFEEEKKETKQETNFEHYKDEILEDYAQNLAVVKGRPINELEFENGRLIDDINKAEYEVRKYKYQHMRYGYDGFEETK